MSSILSYTTKKHPSRCLSAMAPQVGLEPTTTRLTAECSAIELLRNDDAEIFRLSSSPLMESGDDLLSRAVSSQVPSALRGLTSVFGMGTGGTLLPLSPEIVFHFSLLRTHPDNCTQRVDLNAFASLLQRSFCLHFRSGSVTPVSD